ncbi:hypothetical protein SEA_PHORBESPHLOWER_65 [Gordonia phage PhorbesPhlower]|nr:hypothetical protein SEA_PHORBESPHLOWER_65 [Gordonia phage PhorbesPhlower]
MTITKADALEIMACVAACHPRTAPRWHDDPEAAEFTANTWARMFNRHNLELRDLLAAVERRAADTTDTAPEPGEIIQAARSVRRDRSDAEMGTEEGRARRDAAIDSKVQRMVGPLANRLGSLDRPALRAVHPASGDPDRRAKARAELDALRESATEDGGVA